ncbi:MAG: hypothetical protein AAF919_12400 [Pseudomonadota bacterium]
MQQTVTIKEPAPQPSMLPSEICRGAITTMIFEGIGPTEGQIEAIMDRVEAAR